MADFCKACSEELFDLDNKDFVGVLSQEEADQGLYAAVLCEGCGRIAIDIEGNCLSKCLKFDKDGHNLNNYERTF